MLQMSLPWWEFIVRAVVIYLFLLVSLRLSGKRQIGQLSPFDFILLLVLSNAVQNSMNGGDNSMIGGMISALTLIFLNYLLGHLTYKYRNLEHIIDGSPRFLVKYGSKDQKVFDQEKITTHEFEASMRQAGIESVDEIKFALIENTGAISFIRK